MERCSKCGRIPLAFDKYWEYHGHEPNGSSRGSISYREWLLKQTSAVQDAILGKDKATEFRIVNKGR